MIKFIRGLLIWRFQNYYVETQYQKPRKLLERTVKRGCGPLYRRMCNFGHLLIKDPENIYIIFLFSLILYGTKIWENTGVYIILMPPQEDVLYRIPPLL